MRWWSSCRPPCVPSRWTGNPHATPPPNDPFANRVPPSVDRTNVRTLRFERLQAGREGFVAVKIVHTTRSQEVRFGDRATAEHYAAQYGGLGAWRVVPVPGGHLPDGCQAGSRESRHR